jgi:OOP family OmpA-OmpF porin
MKKILGIIIATSLFVATSVFAQDGFYAGASAGSAFIEDDSEGISFSGNDFAWKIFGGYMFNETFGIEAGWADMGSPDDTILGIPTKIEADGYDLFAVGVLPVNDSFDVFGKAGIIGWNAKGYVDSVLVMDDDGTDLALGVGGRLKLSDSMRGRAEFEWFDISDADKVWAISVGIEVRFN